LIPRKVNDRKAGRVRRAITERLGQLPSALRPSHRLTQSPTTQTPRLQNTQRSPRITPRHGI
jgi:hypothetical protein